MILRLFISGVQEELAEERAALRDYLRGPHASVPANSLLAELMFLTNYIERMGTGIRDMSQRCAEAGLPEPEIRIDAGSWVTTIRRKTQQVTEQVRRILFAAAGAEAVAQKLMEILHLSHRPTFLYDYLQPALRQELLEMTQPESPRSPTQKYRLTKKGRDWLAAQEGQT